MGKYSININKNSEMGIFVNKYYVLELFVLTLPPINWWGSYIRRLPDYSKANQTNLFL